jgi:SAM-dependent methyltransferase
MISLSWFAPVFYTLTALVIVWFVSVVGPFFFGAPWVPMPLATVRKGLRLADLQPGETVFDLGSGDGRVLLVAAREYGARAVGVEIEPLRAALSRLFLRASGVGGLVRVVRANFHRVDLSGADVVVLYLLPKAVAVLVPKLRRELKPGARVVTLNYHLPDWAPYIQSEGLCVYRLEETAA